MTVVSAATRDPGRAAGSAAPRVEPTVPSTARWWALLAVAFGSALTFVLAMAPVGWWPLTPLAVAGLAWVAASGRRTVPTLLLLALGWAPVWWWFHRWVADVSMIGLPALVAYLSAMTALGGFVLRCLLRGRGPRCASCADQVAGPPIGVMSRLPTPLLVALGFTGVESLRAFALLDGYPWYLIAHPLIECAPLAQIADLAGATVPGLLVALVGGAIVDLMWRGRAAWRAVAVVGAVTVLAGGYGLWRLSEPSVTTPGPTIVAIQTDLPSDNKTRWTLERQIEDFDDFVHLTLDALGSVHRAGATIDLFAWPETMLPGFGLDPATEAMLLEGPWEPADRFTSVVRLMTGTLGIPMLVGSSSYEGLRPDADGWAWDRHHNSAYLLGPDGATQRYDKLVLTPFGETMPYISAWPWLERRLLAMGASGMRFDLDRGRAPVRLAIETQRGGVRVVTPICFEDTVASLCRRLIFGGGERQAELIVNLSNDGWFGQVDAGRWQHAQAARFRCIENRTPMVRVVNTGITAAYDSAGRLVALAGEDGTGPAWLATTPDLDRRRPLASIVGDALPWSLVALTAVMVAVTMARRP